jgi:hypothetical protein
LIGKNYSELDFEVIRNLKKKAAEKKILDGINDLKTKLENQNKMVMKLVVLISKMHTDGEINRETFNKLDDFLKPYYDQPYENDY